MTRELAAFRAAFGRRCVLAGQALTDGQSREAVLVAWRGEGDNIHLEELRRSRSVVSATLDAWDAIGGLVGDLSPHALDIKHAVEQEWHCTLPIASAA